MDNRMGRLIFQVRWFSGFMPLFQIEKSFYGEVIGPLLEKRMKACRRQGSRAALGPPFRKFHRRNADGILCLGWYQQVYFSKGG